MLDDSDYIVSTLWLFDWDVLPKSCVLLAQGNTEQAF